jgi:hypothetical protein
MLCKIGLHTRISSFIDYKGYHSFCPKCGMVTQEKLPWPTRRWLHLSEIKRVILAR